MRSTNSLPVSWCRTLIIVLACGLPCDLPAGEAVPNDRLQISGIYPHLAVFSSNGECGIGAVVPWMEKLWMITYPPHQTRGGSDKLYEIDSRLAAAIRPESVGGTHACRMIHRESNQLIIGPYFVDAKGNVRAADLTKLVGRMTAVMRHLTDPANKVYFFDMEGAIYEVNVHTLEVALLFAKPVPGWHGKGGYTSQSRVVIANNGERESIKPLDLKYLVGEEPKSLEEAGVLAEWDGATWRIVERKQFADVTGPGGIYGAPDDKSPLWSIGWDRRSLILKALDGGGWHTFRLPKATHTYDPVHGWYTEWPRIREVQPDTLMMDMHGMFYDFPRGFCRAQTGGLRPIASHLRYIPDFCHWDGRVILAADDTSIMANPMAGQSQSNLWFGQLADLAGFGPRSGWGGPWRKDPVKAGEPSDPFLFNGFHQRIVHLSHDAHAEVTFTLELDRSGDGSWQPYQSIRVPARGYTFHIFPQDLAAQWIRVKADADCRATAYFHYASPRDASNDARCPVASLAKIDLPAAISVGLVRPGKHNRNLQLLARTVDAGGRVSKPVYYEVDEALKFEKPQEDRSAEVQEIAAVNCNFTVDAASVIMSTKNQQYRLPKGDPRYDQPFPAGWPRDIRECQSERYLVNVHGTFYEMPRQNGLPQIKPVCSHGRQIMDFCTWRGLLVMTGNWTDAQPDGQYFHCGSQGVGLWCGTVDDLWRLGKPVGKGGPWLATPATPGKPSDPYLMTGYDKKRMELAHDAAEAVEFAIEVDIDHAQWMPYQTFVVPAGRTMIHEFPEGFQAHWLRATANRACKATVQLTYE